MVSRNLLESLPRPPFNKPFESVFTGMAMLELSTCKQSRAPQSLVGIQSA